MNFKRKVIISIALSSLLSHPSFINAHSGRTDSSGCHNNRSTGTYHCHYDSSTSSSNDSVTDSSNEYRSFFTDSDLNNLYGNNLYWDDIVDILETIGEMDGYNEIEKNPSNFDFSNVEFSIYKTGYEKGYQNKQAYKFKKEAKLEGRKDGLKSDEKVIPTKYNISNDIKGQYEEGFIEGQKERWGNLAEKLAFNFDQLMLPTYLPEIVKEEVREKYDITIKAIVEKAYSEGYSSAFINIKLSIPEEYSKVSSLKKEYEKGFYNNSEITKFTKEAFLAGKEGLEYSIPTKVINNHSEQLYKDYFMKGKEEREKEKTKLLEKWSLILFFIIIVVTILIYIRKLRSRTK